MSLFGKKKRGGFVYVTVLCMGGGGGAEQASKQDGWMDGWIGLGAFNMFVGLIRKERR